MAYSPEAIKVFLDSGLTAEGKVAKKPEGYYAMSPEEQKVALNKDYSENKKVNEALAIKAPPKVIGNKIESSPMEVTGLRGNYSELPVKQQPVAPKHPVIQEQQELDPPERAYKFDYKKPEETPVGTVEEKKMEVADKPSNTYGSWLLGLAPLAAGALAGDVQSGLQGSADTYNKFAEIQGKRETTNEALKQTLARQKMRETTKKELKGKGESLLDVKDKGTGEWYKLPQSEALAGVQAGTLEHSSGYKDIDPNKTVLESVEGKPKYALAATSIGKDAWIKQMKGAGMTDAQIASLKLKKEIADRNFIKGASQDLLSDKEFQKERARVSATQDAINILNQRNPIGDAGTSTIFAKGIFGEVGNLAKDERTAFLGSPDLNTTFERMYAKYMKGGTLDEKDRASLINLANIMRTKGMQNANTIKNSYIQSYKSPALGGVDISGAVNPYTQFPATAKAIPALSEKVMVDINGVPGSIPRSKLEEYKKKYNAKEVAQ